MLLLLLCARESAECRQSLGGCRPDTDKRQQSLQQHELCRLVASHRTDRAICSRSIDLPAQQPREAALDLRLQGALPSAERQRLNLAKPQACLQAAAIKVATSTDSPCPAPGRKAGGWPALAACRTAKLVYSPAGGGGGGRGGRGRSAVPSASGRYKE